MEIENRKIFFINHSFDFTIKNLVNYCLHLQENEIKYAIYNFHFVDFRGYNVIRKEVVLK